MKFDASGFTSRPAALIPATAIVLSSVKCNDIHKRIADYGKGTLYGVVGRSLPRSL